MTCANSLGIRMAALSLALAGVFFALYPAIRPFSDESTLQGAEAFATSSWLLAHSLAMMGFILLALGMLGLYGRLRGAAAGSSGITGLVVTWIGIGLTLPYYGAETFALHAVGREAIQLNNVDLLVTLTKSIRFGEGAWFFGLGLLAIAVGPILFAIAVWRSGILAKWSGVPLAVGFSLFLPQFFGPQPVRIGHGLLILVGCWLVAWSLLNPGMGTGGARPSSSASSASFRS